MKMLDTFGAFNAEQRRFDYGPPLSRGAQMMSALCLWIIVKMKVPFFIKIGPLLLKQFDWFKEYRLEFGAILEVIKFDFIFRRIPVHINSWFIFYFVIGNAFWSVFVTGAHFSYVLTNKMDFTFLGSFCLYWGCRYFYVLFA